MMESIIEFLRGLGWSVVAGYIVLIVGICVYYIAGRDKADPDNTKSKPRSRAKAG